MPINKLNSKDRLKENAVTIAPAVAIGLFFGIGGTTSLALYAWQCYSQPDKYQWTCAEAADKFIYGGASAAVKAIITLYLPIYGPAEAVRQTAAIFATVISDIDPSGAIQSTLTDQVADYINQYFDIGDYICKNANNPYFWLTMIPGGWAYKVVYEQILPDLDAFFQQIDSQIQNYDIPPDEFSLTITTPNDFSVTYHDNILVIATLDNLSLNNQIEYVEFQYSVDNQNWLPLIGPNNTDGKDYDASNGWSLLFGTGAEYANIEYDETVWVRARAKDHDGIFTDWAYCAQPFKVNNRTKKFSIQSLNCNKSAYESQELVTLTANVFDQDENSFDDATVNYIVKNSSGVPIKTGTLNLIGNGQYQNNFQAPSDEGSYSIEATAMKDGYQDGNASTSFNVINPQINHDVGITDVTWDSDSDFKPYQSEIQIPNNGKIKINSFTIKNYGDFNETNVPVVMRLIDPDHHNVVYESSAQYVSVDKGTSQQILKSLSISNLPSGLYNNIYDVEITTKLATDNNADNNADVYTVIVGTPGPEPGHLPLCSYNWYRYVNTNSQASVSTNAGPYNIKIHYLSDNQAYFDLSRSGWSKANQVLTKDEAPYAFDNGNLVIWLDECFYMYNKKAYLYIFEIGVKDASFQQTNPFQSVYNYHGNSWYLDQIDDKYKVSYDFYLPSGSSQNAFSYLRLFNPPINYNDLPNKIYSWSLGGNDVGGGIDGSIYGGSMSCESQADYSGRVNNVYVIVPESLTPGDYNMLIVQKNGYDPNSDGMFNVGFAHSVRMRVLPYIDAEISAINLPNNITVDSNINIDVVVKNNSDVPLNNIPVTLSITGNGFSLSQQQEVSLDINQSKPVPFTWNTNNFNSDNGYTIIAAVKAENDLDNSNDSMTKSVQLSPPPQLVVSVSTDKTQYIQNESINIHAQTETNAIVVYEVLRDNQVIDNGTLAEDNQNPGNYNKTINGYSTLGTYQINVTANKIHYLSGTARCYFDVVDGTPPVIVQVSPTGQSVDVKANIVVAFSESVEHSSAEASITIDPSISVSKAWSGNAVILSPNNSLSYGTNYTVSITTNVQDIAGNHLQEDFHWSFTTANQNLSQLVWTGEPNFATDGVNPDTSLENTNFEFRVKYVNSAGDEPADGYPKVHIKKGDAEIAGSPFTMTPVGTDADYTSGRIYSYTTNTLTVGSDYSYWFEAQDVNGNAAVGEATQSKSGPIVANLSGNNKCLYVINTPDTTVTTILNELGMDVTTSDTIPSDLSSYNLVICAYYPACNPTTAPYVGDFVQNGGGAILMGGTPSTFGGGGYSCSNISDWFGTSQYSNVGESYAKVSFDNPLGTSLVRNDVINYCGGWGGAAVKNVASDATILAEWDYGAGNIHSFIRSYQGGRVAFWAGNASYNSNGRELFKALCQWVGDVSKSTNLVWTGEVGYKSDGVNPDSGPEGTRFEFRVKYTDADGDAPADGYPKVHIKKGDAEIAGSPFTMTPVGTDADYTSGRIYSYTTNTLTVGSDYSYWFEAQDVNGNAAVGEATEFKSGPVVNTTQSILSGVIQNENGFLKDATVEVWSSYPDGDLIDTCQTGSDGSYIFTALTAGTYDIRSYADNYYPSVLKNVSNPGSGNNITLELVPSVTPTNTYCDFWGTSTEYKGHNVISGDIVIAKDPTGNICGMCQVTNEGAYRIHVYGDDATTSDIDEGAEEGDRINFYINKEKSRIKTGTDVWTNKGSNQAELEAPSNGCTVNLFPNWNLISFNVTPTDNKLESIINSLSDKISNIAGYISGQGFKTWDKNRPSFLNDLITMNPQYGYWIKSISNKNERLFIQGQQCSIDTPISLQTNWNLIGYLPDYEDNIGHALESLNDAYVFVGGYEGGSNGGFRTWDRNRPSFLNDLQTLKPGRGYWIKMNSSATLRYPSVPQNSGGIAKVITKSSDKYEYNKPLNDDIHKTPYVCDIWGVNQQLLSEGDLIEIKGEDGLVYGRSIVTNVSGFLVHVYGDDPYTKEKEGAKEHEELSIYINGTRYAFEKKVYWLNMSSIEVRLKKTIAKREKPTKFSLSPNCPNPFNIETSFNYSVAKTSEIRIRIFNIKGELIKEIYKGKKEPGIYQAKWHGEDETGKIVSSGIYIILFEYGRNIVSRKITLLK